MDKSRLSLMTFPMADDVRKKNMTVRDTLLLAKQTGIPFVDLLNAADDQIGEYLAAVEETGVQVYTYIVDASFLDSCQEQRKAVIKGLKTASMLKAKYLMIIPYVFQDALRAKTMDRQTIKQCMIEGFRRAVAMGKEYGIRVCFETTPHDRSCLSGTQDCLDVLNAVPELDFVFDTANMLPHGDDPVKAYEALKGRISHVHLKDVRLESWDAFPTYAECAADGRLMRCVVWGEGIIPVEMLYERMISDGYTGCFAVEYVHPGGDCGLEEHKRQLKRFLKE